MAHPSATLYGDIAFICIDSLALISTLLRLCFRWHIRRFWWEDAWAAVAFVSGTVFIVAQYISAATVNNHTAIIASWMTSGAASLAVGAVRMSILYSTIRIMSPLSGTRTFARVVAIFLFLCFSVSVILNACACTGNSSSNLTAHDGSKCVRAKVISTFQVTTDCISDAILVALPLRLLWRVKLPPRQRRMILTLFSSSAIVSIFSLATHGVFQMLLPKYPDEFAISFNMEIASALIVCNLLVVVTYVYRVICNLQDGSGTSELEDDGDDDFTTTRTPGLSRTVERLTTVNLSIDASYSYNGSNTSDGLSPSHSRFAYAEKSGDTGGFD